MNRSELVTALHNELEEMFPEDIHYRTKVARETVDMFFDSIKSALMARDRIEIRGLGSFHIKDYKAYVGRNPKTGGSVDVPEKHLPVFKASKELKKIINE